MKTKIITLFMILSMLFAVASFAQEIDPGTGIKIGTVTGYSNSSWSPDGKSIASTGDGGIYLTSVEGGSSEKIYTSVPYNKESRDYGAGYPCFSPDGKEIFFDIYFVDKNRGTTVETTSWGTVVENNLIPAILAFNIATKTARVVREEARCVHFSNDGRYFGYINYDHRAVTDPANAQHHYAIAIYDNVTQETRYIDAADGTEFTDFSFSSDNTYVAADVDGSRLYRIPLDGSTAEEIISPNNPWGLTYFDRGPRCSPDGRWIMFEGRTASYDYRNFLLVYNAETKETKPFFPVGKVYNRKGEWSPDGKKISCALGISDLSRDGLYIFDFIQKNIGIEPVLSKVPQYIPKDFGTELAKIDLSVIDKADSTLYTGLQNLSFKQEDPIWSPDGKWVAMSFTNPLYGSSIWIIPSEGGLPLKVLDFEPFILYNGYKIPFGMTPTLTGFTPDSQEILYETKIIDESRGSTVTIKEENGSVLISGSGWIGAMKAVNIFTRETRMVSDSALNGTYSHNGKYFVYTNSYPFGAFNLMLYDTETQQTRKLSDNGPTWGGLYFGNDDSYIITVISGTWKKISLDGTILEDTGVNKGGFLSPDFRFLLNNSNGRASLYDTVTKKSEYITPQNNDFEALSKYSFSPDGKKFCYILRSKKTENMWEHVYVRDINPAEYVTVTAVETGKPLVFSLQGNYPNPFNPSTTIQFSLAASGKVNLVIYNVAGQKVRELVMDAEMTPGIHNVLWDGRNDFGIPVSSGIYLSRLQMGGKSLAGRMLLMK